MAKEMETVRSCGFLVVRGSPIREFLLMKHKVRWDLPKGHVDPGESDLECALRELWEETGIQANDIALDPAFRWTIEYDVAGRRYGQAERVHKTVVIFLGKLVREVALKTSEHLGLSVGADKTLADWGQITGYFQRLAAQSPAVHVDTLGPTTSGQPFIVAVISTPETRMRSR